MKDGLNIDMADFNRQVNNVRKMLGRNAGSYVRTTARRVVRRLAFHTPKASPRFRASGRLRAGLWPAAMALNITNIYTRQGNKNEGEAIDNTRAANPSFTIINRVPYIRNLKDMSWAQNAINAVRPQMARDLRKYASDSWRAQALADDLSAD